MVLRRAQHGVSLLLRSAHRRGLIRILRTVLAATLVAGAVPPALASGGEATFSKVCAACHEANGEGLPGVYPPLAHRIGRYVEVPEGRAYLVRVVSFGMFGPIRVDGRPYNGLMPSHPKMSDAEVADVLDYVLTALNTDLLPANFAPLTAQEVHGYRAQPATLSETRKEREALLEALAKKAGTARAIPKITGAMEDYSRHCQGCHREDGMGAAGAVPRLQQFVGYFTRLPGGRDYLMRVPGVTNAHLDDARLAGVLNWMLETFSRDQVAPGFAPFTAAEVGRNREHPIIHVEETRRGLIAQMQAKGLIPPGEDGVGVSPERR
jgi:mono/diheme cytochrome c family protein